jgi:hypothetical protein
MSTALHGLLLVGGIVLLSLAAMFIVRRAITIATLEAHNDVAGFVYAVIGVIYAVLLAFVVIAVWEEWDRAEFAAEEEVAAISSLARIADGMPDGDRVAARQLLRDYAHSVIHEEWPAMADGKSSGHTMGLFEQIWDHYQRREPNTEREKGLYADSLSRLAEISAARTARLYESNNSLPRVMWSVLGAGAVITIGFGLLFGVKSGRSQAAITVALSASIGLILFLVQSLDNPFRGDVRVMPHAFEGVLVTMDATSEEGIRGPNR